MSRYLFGNPKGETMEAKGQRRGLMQNPPHPGKLVKANIEELGISVADAAEVLHVTQQQLYDITNGKSAVSPEMAIRFEKAFGGSAETWLRGQAAYDLARLRS